MDGAVGSLGALGDEPPLFFGLPAESADELVVEVPLDPFDETDDVFLDEPLPAVLLLGVAFNFLLTFALSMDCFCFLSLLVLFALFLSRAPSSPPTASSRC